MNTERSFVSKDNSVENWIYNIRNVVFRTFRTDSVPEAEVIVNIHLVFN